MILTPNTLFITLAILLLFTKPNVHAHTGLSTPCGRYQGAAGCPFPPPGQVVDVNINAPIGTNLAQVQQLCKTSVPYPFASRTVYKAGDIIQTAYSIGSWHGGGHCQWALSYDREKTWVVIKTEIRTCLRVTEETKNGYRVPVMLPKDAPSGNVTFMWLWINAIGQRELYSNCADIRIEGRDGGSVKGVEPLIANYGPSNPVFPEFPTDEYPDLHELFATRRAVTINVKGSNSPSQIGTDPASPPETSQPSRARRSILTYSSSLRTSGIV
ncbi:hypothetical protein BGZ95_008020 [Linnemannia exigua]|uniref:Lytic polysaccharide monooxygenase n=1 Tax=Linnemannia exigua TaxID=604196 RepID=A0AAD4H7Z4_9FUNG|nr:hypothetical protein BGZ95_008020 [Linnemannia exigua]